MARPDARTLEGHRPSGPEFRVQVKEEPDSIPLAGNNQGSTSGLTHNSRQYLAFANVSAEAQLRNHSSTLAYLFRNN